MPSVFNKHHKNYPQDAVYIGRPSVWGNPFSHMDGTAAHFKVATREEAVKQYEIWVQREPEFITNIKSELKGKDLVCWCAPKLCHGDVLLRIANEEENGKKSD